MRRIVALSALLLVSAGAMAQDVRGGRTANTVNGQAGELSIESGRLSRRVDARIQNRVQSRISNRVDRSYSPQGNAASSVTAAGDQLRAASQPRR